MSTLVVVPTYNEVENLPSLVYSLLRPALEAHVLVVDDASPDGTGDLADRMADRLEGKLHALHRPARMGLGTAYLHGFRWALERRYDRIAQMDADLSHDPLDLPRFHEEMDAGADLVLGSRYVPRGATRNWGLVRQMVSRGGNLYARLVLGSRVRDLTGGFKLWRREALEAIPLERVRSEGYAFQIEMTWRAQAAGLRVVEVPILFVDRRVGRSKMSPRIVLEAIYRVPQLRIRAPRW